MIRTPSNRESRSAGEPFVAFQVRAILRLSSVLSPSTPPSPSTRLLMRPVVSRHGMIYRKGETLFPPQPTPQRGQWKQGSIEAFDPEALRPNSLKGRQPC